VVCNVLKIYIIKKDTATSPTASVGRKNDNKMVNSGNKSQIFFVLEAQKISGSCFQNSSFHQTLWVLVPRGERLQILQISGVISGAIWSTSQLFCDVKMYCTSMSFYGVSDSSVTAEPIN